MIDMNEANDTKMHGLSRALARSYGVNAALLMAYLANQIAFYQTVRVDGCGYYESVKKIAKRYPYLTEETIRYTLNQLRKEPVLNASAQNKKGYDKTLWYRFVDPEIQIQALNDLVWFEVKVAESFGVEAALIYRNVKYWINEQRKKNASYKWHKVSPKVLATLLPIPERSIRRALKRLSEGEHRILDRRANGGFDRSFEYSLCEIGNIDWPNSGKDDHNSQIQRPEFPNDRPNSPIHGPNLRTNTYLKDTINKTTLGRDILKTHIQTTPASPGVCVCVSQTSACGAETKNDSISQPSTITASGGHSGQKELPAALISTEHETVLNANGPSLSSDSAAQVPQSGTSLSTGPDEDGFYHSAYEHLESDPSLSLDMKMRVFKAAVSTLAKNGSGVIFDKKSWGKASRFFGLNPEIEVEQLLTVLNQCVCARIFGASNVEGYDPLFYARRGNNLNFFFKYLPNIAAMEGCDLGPVQFESEGTDDEEDIQVN